MGDLRCLRPPAQEELSYPLFSLLHMSATIKSSFDEKCHLGYQVHLEIHLFDRLAFSRGSSELYLVFPSYVLPTSVLALFIKIFACDIFLFSLVIRTEGVASLRALGFCEWFSFIFGIIFFLVCSRLHSRDVATCSLGFSFSQLFLVKNFPLSQTT